MLIGLLIMSCNKDDNLSSADRNVVSNDETVPFEELLVLINVKTSDSTYLVVESVDSVNIYVNNFYWAKINSLTVDTSNVVKSLNDNFYETNNKINYLIIAKQDIKEPDYNTAGEFANYLNEYYELKPGEYACLIESFQVTFNDNSTRKYNTFEYKTFKVEQNSKSAFVGEIEINID